MHVPVEITSDDSVRKGLTTIREHHGGYVAAVIHFAAYYDFFGRPSPKYDEITVAGTRRLLGGLRELDFRVEQFMFSRTMLVHRPAERANLSTRTGRSSDLGISRVEGPHRAAHLRPARCDPGRPAAHRGRL